MQITALNNQSLIDLSIQLTGKAENLLKLAMANNLVPSEPIPEGTEIVIPEGLEIDTDIVRYYEANGILPATQLNFELEEQIELTFLQKVHKILKG